MSPPAELLSQNQIAAHCAQFCLNLFIEADVANDCVDFGK